MHITIEITGTRQFSVPVDLQVNFWEIPMKEVEYIRAMNRVKVSKKHFTTIVLKYSFQCCLKRNKNKQYCNI